MKKKLYKNWWLLTLKGILAIVFGVLLVTVPDISLRGFVRFFGIIIAIGGIFLIFGSFSHKQHNKAWHSWLWEGILDIVLGFIILFFPKFAVSVFVILIAIWAIIVGFSQLFSAMSSHNENRTRWMMLLNALIVIVFSIVLFINPFESAVALTYLAGIFAIIFGIFITLFSIQLKNVTKTVKH